MRDIITDEILIRNLFSFILESGVQMPDGSVEITLDKVLFNGIWNIKKIIAKKINVGSLTDNFSSEEFNLYQDKIYRSVFLPVNHYAEVKDADDYFKTIGVIIVRVKHFRQWNNLCRYVFKNYPNGLESIYKNISLTKCERVECGHFEPPINP
jgi:hypothetical protein